jgi:hypothetical protein
MIGKKDLAHLLSEQAIAISCHDEIEQRVLQCLNAIYTLTTIHTQDDFIEYIKLIEHIVKSSATLSQFRILNAALQPHEIENNNDTLVFFLSNDDNINRLLSHNESIFTSYTDIQSLEDVIEMASNGLEYIKQEHFLELQVHPSCYIKHFNRHLNVFLDDVIEYKCDQYCDSFYEQYPYEKMNEAALSSKAIALAFRLKKVLQFIDYIVSEKSLIEENKNIMINLPNILDQYFLFLLHSTK